MTVDVISAPSKWVEAVSKLVLPSRMDDRLQHLMDLNNEGKLTNEQSEELSSLAELSERISLVRADAFQLLGKRPQ